VHLQKLGTPAAGRPANHAGDMKKFWSIYEKHLATAAAKDEIEELVALVKTGKAVCLLCYERDVEYCHRKRIAEIVHKRTKAGIANLAAPLF
jgi:phosphosulfolactate phosphohydrolase-like enzyme